MSDYTPLAIGFVIGVSVFLWAVLDSRRLRRKAQMEQAAKRTPSKASAR